MASKSKKTAAENVAELAAEVGEQSAVTPAVPAQEAPAQEAIPAEVAEKAANGMLVLRCERPCQFGRSGYVSKGDVIKVPASSWGKRAARNFKIVSSTEKPTLFEHEGLTEFSLEALIRIAAAYGVHVTSLTPKETIIQLIEDAQKAALHQS